MSKEQGYIVRLGMFVTMAAILLTTGIYLIGENQNLFGSSVQISSIFSNVNGLQPGNNVRFGGVNVGTVENILIVNDSTLRVEMKIEESVKEHIKKDAIASIGSDGLVGNMVVNINYGKGNMPTVEDGDVLPSYSRLETADLLNTLGKTNENIAIFSNDLINITEKINRGKGTLSMLLNDSLMANDLQDAMKNIKKTTAHLNATGMQIKDIANQIQNGEGLVGTLINDTVIMNRVDGIITRLEESPFYNQLDTTMQNLQLSTERIAAFSDELNQLVSELNNGEGTLGAILKDTVMAEEFRQTLKNLNEGSVLLNEDLEALQHNFLTKKYFKKQEKETKKNAKAKN